MTEERARQAANIVMAAAALGAAVFVLRSPKLRRMAWQLARQYAAGPLAAWSATTMRAAWEASAPGNTRERRRSGDDVPTGPGTPRASADRSVRGHTREGQRSGDASTSAGVERPHGAGERSAGFAG